MFILYFSSYIITNLYEIEITLYYHLKVKNENTILHKYSKKKSSANHIYQVIYVFGSLFTELIYTIFQTGLYLQVWLILNTITKTHI